MTTTKTTDTAANLQLSCVAEIMASRRCDEYARRAEAAGNPGLAILFRAIAQRRRCYAERQMEILERGEDAGAGGAAHGVREAIMQEVRECSNVYPAMAGKPPE